jgi:hypothetical protein
MTGITEGMGARMPYRSKHTGKSSVYMCIFHMEKLPTMFDPGLWFCVKSHVRAWGIRSYSYVITWGIHMQGPPSGELEMDERLVVQGCKYP